MFAWTVSCSAQATLLYNNFMYNNFIYKWHCGNPAAGHVIVLVSHFLWRYRLRTGPTPPALLPRWHATFNKICEPAQHCSIAVLHLNQ